MRTPASASRGIAYMVIGSLSFGTMTAFVKLASESVPSLEIVFFRSLLGSLMISVLMLRKRVSFRGKNPRLLALRGAFGFTALCMHFYAISKLNLGLAVMLNATAPVFVAMMAPIVLKEKVSPLLWVLTLVCFLGLYLLIGPQLSTQPFPILVGLLSGIMAAMAYVSIRYASKGESPYTIIFYFTMLSTIGSIPFVAWRYQAPDLYEWIWIGGIALTSFFGQVCLTKGIQLAPASVASPFSYLTPVCSFTYGYLIWKDPLSWATILGASLIIASGSLIYVFEKKTEPIGD